MRGCNLRKHPLLGDCDTCEVFQRDEKKTLMEINLQFFFQIHQLLKVSRLYPY